MPMDTLLTDSEWKIMRVLWGKGAAPASLVADSLFEETRWSKTTVKTFLSRLFSKGLVGHHVEKNRFVYTPSVTERSCVVAEMQSVLRRVYGGTPRGTTDHFVFYGVDDPIRIQSLGNRLEYHYTRIETDFGAHQDERQIVYLYPSQARLHSALGLENGPEWLRAGMEWDILHLAPETSFTDMSMEEAGAHVWIQSVLHRIQPSIPYWLSQGIAAYESGWISPERIAAVLRKRAGEIVPRTVKSLSQRFDSFRSSDGYELSWTVVDFILRTFGRGALAAYIAGLDAREAFGCDEETFWTRWATEVRRIPSSEKGKTER